MKRRIIVLGLFLAIIVFLSLLCNQTYPDVSSMEKKIAKELDIDQVSIFVQQDVDDYRFVGYVSDRDQGFAVFKQNKNGDYTFEYVKKEDKMISRVKDIFYDYYASYWVVVSHNENLKTIESRIKYNTDSIDEIIKLEVTDNPSISISKLPEKDYEVEYCFYDKEGNLIQ
ncbi:MAG: hypothetical protein K0S47_2142 [Herbinix sp.]|jgi:hypothetical protein|nr:hypothetical protein [Herbinix sp.]